MTDSLRKDYMNEYMKKNRWKYKEYFREYKRNYAKTYNKPWYNKARNAVKTALASGKLVKQPCEVCATETDIQAHHPDYNYFLKVMWLCRKHHGEWHKNNQVIYPKE